MPRPFTTDDIEICFGTPSLVIAPTSLLLNWQAELARFAPALRTLVLHGPDRDFTAIEAHDVVITTTAPFMLRRLKAEVAKELPPRTDTVVWCELAPAQRRLYETVLAASRARVMAAVEESGVARSQITSMLAHLRERLDAKGIAYEYLDGRTKNRQAKVDRFNQGDAPLFLISLKAGGTGLNLVGADYVIHYGPWWNPAVEDQATDRAHCIGQTRQVFNYKLLAKDTVEEKLLQLQEQKRSLVRDVLDADALGKALTLEDLKFLFGEEPRVGFKG